MSVKRIGVPGVIFQMPIVFPGGDLIALVAENHAESSVGVCRLVPYRSFGAFVRLDFRVAQLEQLGVGFAQLIRYRTALNVSDAPMICESSGWQDHTSCPCP